MKTRFGTITEVSGDPPLFNGEPVDLSLQPDAPREARVEAVFDGVILTDWQYDLTSWPEREKIPWHVALAWPDNDDIDAASEYAKAVQDRQRQIGQGRWDVRVKPFMVRGLGFGPSTLNGFDFRGFSRHVKETSDFDATHWMVVGGWHRGGCGLAKAGGETSQADRSCGPDTGSHELNHNGIKRNNHVIHAGVGNSQYAAGTLQGQGNRDDVSSVHLDIMDVIEENNVKTLVPGESGLFFLTQGSADPLSLRPGEDKLVYCEMGRQKIRKLAIEYHDSEVWVHKPGHANSDRFRQTWVLAKLDPGERETIEGVLVEFLEDHEGAAKVYVNHHHDKAEIPRHEFPQWTAPENAHSLTEAQSGIWNNPAWNKQGLLVRVNEGRVAAHWIGWSRLGYRHQFRWINSTITGNYAEGPLYSTEDGKAAESGRAIVYWYGPDLGIMRGWDKDLGRFAIPLHRLGQGTDDPINGYYGLGDGEGLAINRMGNGQYVGFWLGSETNIIGTTTQLWRQVQGESLDALTITEVSGGMAWVDAETTLTEIGPAVIADGKFSEKTMARLA